MDTSSFIGILIGVAGLLVGLLLEGGHIGQILQPTAAMIVFGGTLGAVMLQFPLRTIGSAGKRLLRVFVPRSNNKSPQDLAKQLIQYANKARRSGIVSLDQELDSIQDPFLKKALMLAVDGTEPAELRKTMELHLDNQLSLEEKIPSVFDAAGGFSPTIGILGAVMGLIQVMQHLDKIEEVGRGIAVAFVATIYGVGAANLFFLPVAGKLRGRIEEEHIMKEMALEGVISILEGMNPRMIETKLESFILASRVKKSRPIAISKDSTGRNSEDAA